MNVRIAAYLKSEGAMKKFLQIFALCALCVLAAPMVFAQNDEPVITATKDNFRNVIAAIKESCTLEIVGEIDTKTVKLLGDALRKKDFQGISFKLDMSKVTGLEHIENWSFGDCYCIDSVILPSGVRIIGKSAFCGAGGWSTNIKSITLSDTVQNIGDRAFWWCGILESIIIPDSVKIIGDSAFGSCWKIESVIIPDKVERIGSGAFYDCKNLKSVKLGSGVKSIGARTFERCPNLSEFIVDEKNEHIKFVDGILFNSDEASIICCIFDKDINSYVIPDSIESIEEWAFTDCHFKTVTIPNSVKKIGEYAFYGSDLESITIPAGIENIEKGVFAYCLFIKNLIIPSNIKKIGQVSFSNCKNLEYVTIQDGTENIDKWAFDDCGNLKSITIPTTVKCIEKGAFENCTSLETINFTGAQTQWNSIKKGKDWNKNCPKTMKINFNYQE